MPSSLVRRKCGRSFFMEESLPNPASRSQPPIQRESNQEKNPDRNIQPGRFFFGEGNRGRLRGEDSLFLKCSSPPLFDAFSFTVPV